MHLDYLKWFQDFPPQLATLLIATLPFGELRVSIPIGFGVYELSLLQSFIFSVMGNIIPVIFLLLFLESFSRFLMRRIRFFDRFFRWLFERTRKKYTKRFKRWGAIALVTLVAIPLPMTGGWTGALAAFVFGIPFKIALPLISLGIVIAGIIVSLVVQGATFL